jgi:hypothetical protein
MSISPDSNGLPRGLTFDNGIISGVPQVAGEFTFTVTTVTLENGDPLSKSSTDYALVVLENRNEAVAGLNSDPDYGINVPIGTPSGSKPHDYVLTNIPKGGVLFELNGPFSHFMKKVWLNGKLLKMGEDPDDDNDGDYTAAEGSTKITIREQTLQDSSKTNQSGTNTIVAEFRADGDENNELKLTAQNFRLDLPSDPPPNNPVNPTQTVTDQTYPNSNNDAYNDIIVDDDFGLNLTTEEPTNPPTSLPTNPPTEPSTQPPTQPPTQRPTQPSTQSPTQPLTQPPTDPPTQYPVQYPSEPVEEEDDDEEEIEEIEPPFELPEEPDIIEIIEIEGDVTTNEDDDRTIVTVEVTEDDITKGLDNLGEKDDPDSTAALEIVVDAPEETNPDETVIILSAEALRLMAEAAANGNMDSLRISSPAATIILTPEIIETILAGIAVQNADELVIKINANPVLTDAQNAAINGSPAFGISFMAGDIYIGELGGTLIVELPYTLKPGEKENGVYVYYISDDGTTERMPSYYINGKAILSTTHLSIFAIGYEEPKTPEIPETTKITEAPLAPEKPLETIKQPENAKENPTTGDSLTILLLMLIFAAAGCVSVIIYSEKIAKI